MQHQNQLFTFLGWLALTILTAACGNNTVSEATEASNEPTAKPPNIVYILVDDMGYGDLSCYGQQTLTTPIIDGLAQQGMRFTQHYAGATVCAPSRSSLLTGRHPGHNPVRGNQPAGQLIDDELITIPEALKPAGYTSAVIGKWGIGHPPTPQDPLRNGFDHYYGYINMWHAHNFYPEFLYRNGEQVSLPGNVTDWSYDYAKYHPDGMPEGTGVAKEKETYALFELEKEALAFMEDNRAEPFFLLYALNMPHANNEAGYFLGDGMEVPGYGRFADKDWPNPEKGFAAMMELIDQSVGKLLDKLEQLGLAENTIIVFASDNGPHQEGGHKVDFFDSNGPYRGSKRDLYEGGIRVPMIVKWPGKVKPGSETDHPSAFWDVLPTFCAIAEVEIPSGTDGISFLPTLIGQAAQQEKHDFLYWEFYEQGGRQAVRQGPWKYIKQHVRDEESIRIELYNLDNDPGETTNIIAEHPEVAKSLEAAMQQAHQPHPLISLFRTKANAETAF